MQKSEAADAAATSKVRVITPSDVDWFIDLGLRRYPVDWSPIGTELWLRNIIASPATCLALRSDNAAIVVTVTSNRWTPNKFEALAQTVMAEEGCMWELFPLLRAAQDWAARKRCGKFKMATETAYDLGPIAKRIGLHEAVYYEMDL